MKLWQKMLSIQLGALLCAWIVAALMLWAYSIWGVSY